MIVGRGALVSDVQCPAAAAGAEADLLGEGGCPLPLGEVLHVIDIDGVRDREIIPRTPKRLLSGTSGNAAPRLDGEHKVHDVVSYSYRGCDQFLPSAQCRGAVKYRDKP